MSARQRFGQVLKKDQHDQQAYSKYLERELGRALKASMSWPKPLERVTRRLLAWRQQKGGVLADKNKVHI